MLRQYLDAMDIAATAKVLDIGCGTGLATRAIAGRGRFAGTVTGVDLSAYLVAAGRGWLARRGPANGWSFVPETLATSSFQIAASMPLLRIRC